MTLSDMAKAAEAAHASEFQDERAMYKEPVNCLLLPVHLPLSYVYGVNAMPPAVIHGNALACLRGAWVQLI
jgi:hypothetical protein